MLISPHRAGATGSPVVGWLGDPALRGLALRQSLRVVVAGLAIPFTLALTGTLAFVAGAGLLASVIGGGALAGGLAGAINPLQIFAAILSFFFFGGNLTPYAVSALGQQIVVTGLGPVIVAGLVSVFAYRGGRALQRALPAAPAPVSTLRAAAIAAPYWVIAVVLWFIGQIHPSLAGIETGVTLGPSALGLLTTLMVAAVPAMLGAFFSHPAATGPGWVAGVLRGGRLGVLAVGFGTAGAIAGAILATIADVVWALIASAGGGSTSSHSGATGGSGTLPGGGGSAGSSGSGGSNGALSLLLGIGFIGVIALIVLGIVYLLNDLGLLWTNTLGIQVFMLWGPPAVLLLIGAVLFATVPALSIQPRPDYAQQIGFAVGFGLLSFVLALGTRIAVELPSTLLGGALSSIAVGIDPALILLCGLVVGAVLALLGPLAATTGIGDRAAFLTTRLVVPLAPPLGPAAAARGVPGPAGVDRAVTRPFAQSPGPSTSWTGESTVVVPAARRPRSVRQVRLIWAAAGAIVVLLAAGLVGNGLGTRATGPQTIAQNYVQAVGANDVAGIWNSLDQNSTGSGYRADVHQAAPAGLVDLTTKQGLTRLLSIPANRQRPRTDIHITDYQVTGRTATVTVAYEQAGKAGSTTVHLVDDTSQHRLGLYPHWGVAPVEDIAVIAFPQPSSRITFDGVDVTRTARGFGLAQIFPGTHRLTLAGSGLFKAASTTAFWPAAGAEDQNPFNFDLSLTSDAQTQVENGINAAFQGCAQQETTRPDGCPLAINDSNFYDVSATWTLVGMPGDPPLQIWQSGASIDVIGHYLARAAIPDGGQTAHRFSAGAYFASFSAQGAQLKMSQLQYSSDARGLPAPKGVTTAQVLSAAQTGLQACAALTLPENIDDCPQQAANIGATNWSLQGNPVQGASVQWHGAGYWTVTGYATMNFAPAPSDSHWGDTPGTWSAHYKAWVIPSPSGPDAVYFVETA